MSAQDPESERPVTVSVGDLVLLDQTTDGVAREIRAEIHLSVDWDEVHASRPLGRDLGFHTLAGTLFPNVLQAEEPEFAYYRDNLRWAARHPPRPEQRGRWVAISVVDYPEPVVAMEDSMPALNETLKRLSDQRGPFPPGSVRIDRVSPRGDVYQAISGCV